MLGDIKFGPFYVIGAIDLFQETSPATSMDAFKKTFSFPKLKDLLLWRDFPKDVVQFFGESYRAFYERTLVKSFYNIMLSLVFQYLYF